MIEIKEDLLCISKASASEPDPDPNKFLFDFMYCSVTPRGAVSSLSVPHRNGLTESDARLP